MATEENKPKETQPKKLQSFKLKLPFKTADKQYNVGDTFEHNDKRVINFLKSKKII